MRCTLDIHGQKLRVGSQRQFVAVAYRENDILVEGDGVYLQFAEVIKRSDDPLVVRKVATTYRRGNGTRTGVWDTHTGREI